MSTSHHGVPEQPSPQDLSAMNRFMDQLQQRAKRAYSEGRISPKDEGDLAFAISADMEKRIVLIDFGKEVTWIGMGPEQAVALAEKLIEKAKMVATKPLTVKIG